jgi:hypothetical protein
MTVDQLIRDLRLFPAHALVRVRIYGSTQSRPIIHGPVRGESDSDVELILDRDDRAITKAKRKKEPNV